MKKMMISLLALFLTISFTGSVLAMERGNKRKGKYTYRKVYSACFERGEIESKKPLLSPDTKTQAQWTRVFDKTDLMRNREIGMFPFGFIKGEHFRKALPDLEYLAPFDVPALAILRGKEVVANPLLGSRMFKFQAVPGIFSANPLGVAGSGSDLGLL